MIVGARNERLFDAGGHEYIDLCAGYGSVWLGHNHPAVTRALGAQLEGYAAPGYLPSSALGMVQKAFAPFIPPTHFLGGIYSTGMEAIETALRAARAHTGRSDIAGFEGSTHGRSFLTSAVGGNGAEPTPAFVHRLPAFDCDAERLVDALQTLAARARLAAIVVEPIQMTGGGHALPAAFCEALFRLAGRDGIPVVFDETLTGLYRSGTRYFFESTGQVPDVFVLGKGLANGFPASAVVLRKGFAWDRERVHPGSTFWNHPLACAAVAATLDELARSAAADKVRAIERIIRDVFGDRELRGRGAMWCIASPDTERLKRWVSAIGEARVVVSYYDRYIRLLPPLNIGLRELTQACGVIAAAYADTHG